MFIDQSCEFQNRYKIQENGNYVTLKRFYGKIYQPGTPINYRNMNNIEDKLADVEYNLKNKAPDELGIVTANLGKMARKIKDSEGFPIQIYSNYTFLNLSDITISSGKISGENIVI